MSFLLVCVDVYVLCAVPGQRWDARQDLGTWRITTLLLGLFFTLVLLIAVRSIVWRGVLTWRIIMQFVDVKKDEERLLHLASKSTWEIYFLAANLRGPIFFITKVKCPAHQDQGFVLGQLDVECVDSRELELQAELPIPRWLCIRVMLCGCGLWWFVSFCFCQSNQSIAASVDTTWNVIKLVKW